MARKRSSSDKPLSELDPLDALELERAKLEKRFEELTKRARGELGDVGFWGVVGGIALAADWALLGGIGTAFAAISSVEFLAYKAKARAVNKDLKVIRDKVIDLQEARFRADLEFKQQAPKPGNDNSLKDEFSPAAKAEIEALQKKLAKLSGQVDELQADKDKGLDKPKFRPPFPGGGK